MCQPLLNIVRASPAAKAGVLGQQGTERRAAAPVSRLTLSLQASEHRHHGPEKREDFGCCGDGPVSQSLLSKPEEPSSNPKNLSEARCDSLYCETGGRDRLTL